MRVVNVVDLMRLLPDDEHPHGLPAREFDTLFTEDRPVIFAFHGYPWLVHRLTYKRRNHEGLHVHGFQENGTTTTPFDMVMLNDLDRYRLAIDVIDRVPGLGTRAAALRQQLVDARLRAAEVDARARRGHRRGRRVDVDRLTRARPHRQCRLDVTEALRRRSVRRDPGTGSTRRRAHPR